MKRFSILAVTAILAMGVALGCSKKSNEPVKLELFYYKQEIRDALQEMVNTYSKENPNVSFELIVVPNESLAALRTRAQTGKAPDIMQFQAYSQVFEFADAGYLADLSGEDVIGKVLDSAKNGVTRKGKVYALPMDMAGIGIIYNKELFKKAGIATLPATIQELQDACKKLKEAKILPFAGLLKANWSAGHFITLVHTTLGITSNGSDKFNKWIAGMDEGNGSYGDIVKKDELFKIMDIYKSNMSSNAIEWDWPEQQAAFAKGKAAMMVQGLWSYGAAVATNPKLDCGFIPFPCTNNSKDAKFYADVDSTFGVSSQSSPEKQDAAKKFLTWLSTPEGVKLWTTKCKLTSTFKGADLSGMDKPFQELMHSVAANGAYPWAFSMYPSSVFEDACKNGAQQYFFGKKTPTQVITDIDAQWRKAKGK
jgi:raffinose/stachyose/melibiose transport system substrate-binding protein